MTNLGSSVTCILLLHLLRSSIGTIGLGSNLDVHDAGLGEVPSQVLHHDELLLTSIRLGSLVDTVELRNKLEKLPDLWVF